MSRSKSINRTIGGIAKRVHTWSPEMELMLKDLWSDGEGDSKIAETLNLKFTIQLTRNAIQGRINLLKLPGRKGGVRGQKMNERIQRIDETSAARVKKSRGKTEMISDIDQIELPEVVVHVDISDAVKVAEDLLQSVEVNLTGDPELQKYNAQLALFSEVGKFELSDIADKEERLQSFYRNFPIGMRPSGGMPRLCRWPVESESESGAFLLCGKIAKGFDSASLRGTPRCEEHHRRGVQGGSDGVAKKITEVKFSGGTKKKMF